MAQIKIGISGWLYPPWRGVFYPQGLVQKKELHFASRQVQSIEINGTFYSLKKPEHFAAWVDQVPANFPFAVKGGKYVTHVKRARDCDQALANFFASGLLKLGTHLGPILWQFPPDMKLKDDRFEDFCRKLPRTMIEAGEWAEMHNDKVAGRAWTEPVCEGAIRHAFEFRHPSFIHPDFLAMLRSYNIAMVNTDGGEEKWGVCHDLTADFAYIRMHGCQLPDGYSDPQLQVWASQVQAVAEGHTLHAEESLLDDENIAGRDVFVFFDNDAKAMAPKNAMRLIELTSSADVKKASGR